MFFSPMDNLLLPGNSLNMGDGWETRRRRGPGFDWVVIQLGVPGLAQKIEIDTSFFKGNYPDRCRLDACYHKGVALDGLNVHDVSWQELLPETKLSADKKHLFTKELVDVGPITHIKMSIYPDGGVSRLRVIGVRAPEKTDYLEKLNHASEQELQELFSRCCGSNRWVQEMISIRPFQNVAHLLECAGRIWSKLPHTEWLEAFTHHPKIGDMQSLREKFKNTQHWAEKEQAGMAQASDEILQKLADGNKAYEEKFGYIFIVCATGKSASEMLQLLEKRLSHTPYEELKIAAEEQLKITRLRLKKV